MEDLKRTNVNITQSVYDKAIVIARNVPAPRGRRRGLSNYVERLIKEDLERRKAA